MSKDLDQIMKKIVFTLTAIWSIFLLPSFILLIFNLQGMVRFSTQDTILNKILYYNINLFPLFLISSVCLSWLFLKYKKYWASLAFGLLPLVTFFVELIAADLFLFFT